MRFALESSPPKKNLILSAERLRRALHFLSGILAAACGGGESSSYFENRPLIMKKVLREGAFAAVERITGWVGSISSLVVHTVVFFAAFLVGYEHYASWDTVLLVLTTAVSLEAIYLAIFIQMTVNEHTRSLREVEQDIDEIEEDIDEIQEDVEDIADAGEFKKG